MGIPPGAPPRPWSPRRSAVWGFVIGVVIVVPATIAALLSHTGEAVQPYLVPGAWVLSPLRGLAADLPGLVNMATASLVNGLVYAAILAAAMTALRRR